MPQVLVATSNAGKLRDLAGAAAPFGVTINSIPNIHLLPEVVEDGLTFEANARKKAVEYSLRVPGELVLADDSGLEVDALGGAPGVHSARYAAAREEFEIADGLDGRGRPSLHNSSDSENNARLLREMAGYGTRERVGQFVCVLAVARDGELLGVFSGSAFGFILDSPRGSQGFGYDPLFFFPPLERTFAELTPEEKGRISHRGVAFRAFLDWYRGRHIL